MKPTEVINKLDELRLDLDEGKKDELSGMQNYIQSILDLYGSEKLNESSIHSLENHLLTVYKLENYYFRKLQDDLNSIKKEDHNYIFKNENVRISILGKLKISKDRMQRYYNVLQVRVVVCAFLYDSYKSERYSTEALKALDKINDIDDFVARIQKYCNIKFDLTRSSIFGGSEALEEKLEKELDEFVLLNKQGNNGTKQIHEFLFNKTDYSFYLKIEDGLIV